MRRSEINRIVRDMEDFLVARRFHLPRFADWSVSDWRRHRPAADQVVDRRLGWDVTDFDRGNFDGLGLFLFTIRNGRQDLLSSGRGMLYAEKILVSRVNQIAPMHYHKVKTEDIINRGGGIVALELVLVDPDDRETDHPFKVRLDGIERSVSPHEVVRLAPGDSITLEPHVAHRFWAERTMTLIGEVSLVNDDGTDNYFLEDVGRFPSVEEDEAPYRLLVSDYDGLHKWDIA